MILKNILFKKHMTSRHEAIMPLCFPVIPFILTDYAQNYTRKFNEVMIVIVKSCARVQLKVNVYCSYEAKNHNVLNL